MASSPAPEPTTYDVEDRKGNIDITKSEDQKEPVINGYIHWWIRGMQELRFRDDELFYAYQEAFEDWTETTFRIANSIVRYKLRDFLRSNGVFVKLQGKIVNLLPRLAQEEEPPAWPEEDVNRMVNGPTEFNSRHNPYLAPRYSTPPEVKPSVQPSIQRQPVNVSGNSQSPTPGPNTSPQPNQSSQSPSPPPNGQSPSPPPNSQSPNPPNRGATPSFTPGPMGSGYGKELATLGKLYKDDMLYSGPDDDLDYNLQMFYSACNKAQVPEAAYVEAFDTMLSGEAKDYFYGFINGHGLTFDGMVNQMKIHFETEERRQGLLSKWYVASLRKFFAEDENQGKSKLECFGLFVRKLQKIQRGLAPEYQTHNALRERLVNACRSVKECHLACFDPSPDLEGFCAQIRQAIGTQTWIEEPDKPIIFVTETPPQVESQSQPGESFLVDPG